MKIEHLSDLDSVNIPTLDERLKKFVPPTSSEWRTTGDDERDMMRHLCKSIGLEMSEDALDELTADPKQGARPHYGI